MLIGVTGDTHNNLNNINKICAIFNENHTDLVFHTGDISLPKSLLAFNQLNCPLIVVLGNNDIEERNGLEEVANSFECKIFDEPFSIELNSIKILIFSFLFSLLSSIWFKNPGENFISPILSIFLLETTILENNGFLRIIRPFAFFFFGTLLFCLIFWKRDFKN